ncbi:2',5'-phosphodiesterase 12 [Galendromus occidentalis]|uniref:2',5'-phosphodiesterase 12 n=1 Tax=Galendromus occidentalis TaxID=34638 RepID=A0AAJ7L6W8_9ACAR|nr:2',5'-phosphodiesterase 12 [Galendromus occidentalis]
MIRVSHRLLLSHSKFDALKRAPGSIAGIRRSNMTSTEKRRLAFVSLNEEKQKMLLSFRLQSEIIPDRMFTLNRGLDEALEIALTRTKKNITVEAEKRMRRKRKKSEDEDIETPEFEVHVEDPLGKVLEPFLSNREAFKTGNTLKVGTHSFLIVVNAPTIVRLDLPSMLIVGCPVQAYVSLEHAKLEDCVFSWWIKAPKFTAIEKYPEDDVRKIKGRTFLRLNGECSNIFYPTEEHVGQNLMVECEPRREDAEGVRIQEISDSVVTHPTGYNLYDDRLKLTAEILPDDEIAFFDTVAGSRFRVVSYNLLANIYAHTKFSKNVLFGYCPSWALDFKYRKHLLMREILGYNGDILCLQEVDRSMFSKDLYPSLSRRDFEGFYAEKCGQNSEGVAIFFRKSKFELLEQSSLTYSQAIRKQENLADLKEAVNANEMLRLRLKELNQMYMQAVLKHKASEKHLVVGNTHLFFHPNSDHIRLLQALVGLRELQSTAARFKDNDSPCASLFCGDFNSTPEFAVYQLFTTGHVPKDSLDWISVPEEKISGVVAKIERCMKSACGTPEFTNYTVEFKACLDYIFHSEEIAVDSIVPLPSEDLLAHEEYKAIPSPIFPSDHLALVANLKFRK